MTNTVEPTDPTPPTRRGRSLRAKLFTPFVLILILLGFAAIYGSVGLVRKTTTQTADERLLAAQEILFREFKKQETILQTYAILLQHFENLSQQFSGNSELGILQDRLFNTLEESNITVMFYPIDVVPMLTQKSLVLLFESVDRSLQPRFRYSNEFGDLPVLMVGVPLFEQGEIKQFMLLYTAMGDQFLRKVADPLDVRSALINLDGEVVAKSHEEATPHEITPAQRVELGQGNRIYFNDKGHKDLMVRHQISAIPLGTTDLIFLSIESSLARVVNTQQQLLGRLLLTIVAALFIGMVVYFRIISNMTRPVHELKEAAKAIRKGNFKHRITEISSDELGEVGESFNKMVDVLEENYQKRAAGDIEKVLAQEYLKHKSGLEKQERETTRAQEDLQRIQREMSAIYQLNQAMISSTDLPLLFDRILQVINDTLGCDHLVLLVYNAGESILEVVKTAGIDYEVLRDIRFTFDQGITGEAAQNQRMIYIKNLDKDDRNLSYYGQIVTRGSMVSVPLVVKGRLCGVLNLHKKQIEAFSTSELKLIQAVANQTAIAIDNNQLVEKARDLSSTDELTGLANRRHFQEILKREVAQARRFSSNFSIIMCEIDQTKTLTEAHGRMNSDALLRQVGQSLLKNTRGIDLTSRFGAEQFVILLPKTNKQGALAAAEKLRHCILEEKFDLSGVSSEDLNITLSLGVTEFPADSKNIYELLNLADRALYAAKKEGHNRTVAWEGPVPDPK